MTKYEFLGKKNRDGSFSVSIPAGVLISAAFVDYYNDANAKGYQRDEKLRPKRAREIEDYIRRCQDSQVRPRLYELTLNARLGEGEWHYGELDEAGQLGLLTIETEQSKWLSVIDGGTRLEGIHSSLTHNLIDSSWDVDARIFLRLDIVEEIGQFFLINENQKRVRTDLALRVVQRSLDDGNLNDSQLKVLSTVVPDTDQWKYSASRIAGSMNTSPDSPWKGLIQMPNDHFTQPVKLQAYLTSLQPLLKNDDLMEILSQMEKNGNLLVDGKKVLPVDFLTKVLNNFWKAVQEVNQSARDEPSTNVLWGSIGVSAAHIALAPIFVTILQSPNPNLTTPVFRIMLAQSFVAEYDYWFTRKGSKLSAEQYPNEKGEATTFTGGAGYGRLGKELETQWRSALHSSTEGKAAVA